MQSLDQLRLARDIKHTGFTIDDNWDVAVFSSSTQARGILLTKGDCEEALRGLPPSSDKAKQIFNALKSWPK